MYIENIYETPDHSDRLIDRFRATRFGARVCEFARRPAVANTIAVLGLAAGALGLAALAHEAVDAVQDYRDSSATVQMYDELMRSGPELQNQLLNGADVDHSQYVQ